MGNYDLLVVEDDLDLCEALCETLSLEGYKVDSAENGAAAIARMENNRYRLVVSDVQMPVMDGFQLLKKIRNITADLPVVLMTAYGTIPKAVEAMQIGANDYLVKPFDADKLVSKVSEFVDVDHFEDHAGPVRDEAMRRLYSLAEKVAETDVTVLLQGESGTGKEVFARFIHRRSACRKGPFVAVNCAAIPENMLEAMLFGYEKGAFTGALQTFVGKFEQAQNGTLLLDEVAEMDLSLQAKLLRVLQERELERLGGRQKIPLNVRVLAASNRVLRASVESGDFREDLYYRLNVFPLNIPPLRERSGDILPLAEYLVRKYRKNGGEPPALSPAAVDKMLQYAWPGNVRELENVLQRALILQTGNDIRAEDIVLESDLPVPHFGAGEPGISGQSPKTLESGVRSMEEKIILQTLMEENGSRKSTAEKLGISPRTLRYKIARMKEAGVALPL
ncbi:MAG: sigma-54-dependent transcriptional regulator [Gammaproteobacteria bacterium]